jgi:lipid-A-disaccharide synthase
VTLKPRILVSAGETSGDLYAAHVVRALARRLPGARFAGCPGPRMKSAHVEAVIDQSKLAVVGLAEVVTHLPSIYFEYRKLIRWAARERPHVAILTDSSGFHLRVARSLKNLGIPVVYLVAPQAWAWRKGRVKLLKRNVSRLLCIFPFEEQFFRSHGVPAAYIGHPLARLIRPSLSREEFFARYGIAAGEPVVAWLPGSRQGEIARHLPVVKEAAARVRARHIMATPPGMNSDWVQTAVEAEIKVLPGQAWDAIAHADLAVAASGTVTIEATLLGTPMVTFYKVNTWTWRLGRPFVDVPHFSMVNLIAGKKIVPELIQGEANGERIAAEARTLLTDAAAREAMRFELRGVAKALMTENDPIETAADYVMELLEQHVS